MPISRVPQQKLTREQKEHLINISFWTGLTSLSNLVTYQHQPLSRVNMLKSAKQMRQKSLKGSMKARLLLMTKALDWVIKLWPNFSILPRKRKARYKVLQRKLSWKKWNFLWWKEWMSDSKMRPTKVWKKNTTWRWRVVCTSSRSRFKATPTIRTMHC